MANIGVPPAGSDFKPIESDIYEIVVTGVEEIPNTWYDPDVDPPSKKTQLEWSLVIREQGEFNNARLRYYTGSAIGRHPRNKLTNFVKVIDGQFDIDTAYKDWAEFESRTVGQVCRAVVEQTPRKDGEGTYGKVTGVLPSKMDKLSDADKLAVQLGAREV